VVDAAIRGSFDIYTGSMTRIKYNLEHPPEAEFAIAKVETMKKWMKFHNRRSQRTSNRE
jgi:hypothetical protein